MSVEVIVLIVIKCLLLCAMAVFFAKDRRWKKAVNELIAAQTVTIINLQQREFARAVVNNVNEVIAKISEDQTVRKPSVN